MHMAAVQRCPFVKLPQLQVRLKLCSVFSATDASSDLVRPISGDQATDIMTSGGTVHCAKWGHEQVPPGTSEWTSAALSALQRASGDHRMKTTHGAFRGWCMQHHLAWFSAVVQMPH